MRDPLDSLRAVLGSRYEIGDVIGRGGMATVYQAADHQLGRTVAMKVLSPDLAPLLGEVRFHREIAILSRLHHPGIVPLYEAGGQGHVLYYTMPLVVGETLRARLERERQLPVGDAIRISLDVAQALSHAHAEGVVHRDIKPENILLTGERVQVADFGIAHAISVAGQDRLTSAGVALGTPSYMSPEQATRDGVIDGRADIYSLGCMLYEMLAGQPPYAGATPQAVVARHMIDPVPSLRVVRSGVSPALESFIAQCLEKSPADRPDAKAFVTELHDAMTHPDRIQRKGRNRLLAIGTAVVLTAAVAAWLVAARPGTPLDDNAVVVFPLSAPGQPANGAGELVSLLIGSTLEHTEPLRWIPGWTELNPEARADMSALSGREAERVSRRLGAEWYIEGALLPHGDSLSVTLRLHNVATDSVYQESAHGLTGRDLVQTATHLAQRAVVPLLGALVGHTRHVELKYLENRSPAAIALWLEGEQQKRGARFNEALSSYRRALAIDSTLAVAALTAAGVVLWTSEATSTADSLAQLALRHSKGLPARNLAFIRGMIAYVAQDADSALGLFRVAIAADSLWPEGWMMLGDTYYHLLPAGGHGDSLADVAFGRAVALDPTFGPALFHLAEGKLRLGDTTTGKLLIERFRGVAPDSSFVPELETMLACQRGRGAEVPWSELAKRYPLRVLTAARLLGAGAKNATCAAYAAKALMDAPADSVPTSIRWAALKWLHHWAVARGRMSEASGLIERGIATIHPAAQGLFVLDAVATGGDSAMAAATMRGIDGEIRQLDSQWLWYLGIWAAHLGESGRLEQIIQRLESLGAAGSRADRDLAMALSGRAALFAGDTTAAISQLRRLENPTGDITWGLRDSGAGERLLLARLLLATGKPVEAFAIAAEFDGTQTILYLYYLPASLKVRIAAADQLGRETVAGLLRERLRRIVGNGAS